jgi:transposase-like protein
MRLQRATWPTRSLSCRTAHGSCCRDTVSRITDAVVEDLVAWQNRPLDRGVYPRCC